MQWFVDAIKSFNLFPNKKPLLNFLCFIVYIAIVYCTQHSEQHESGDLYKTQ